MRVTYRTYCARMDHGGCGLLVTVDDGRIVKVQGDPDSPISHGHVCPKGLAIKELHEHPARLKRPLLRVGRKGEDRWKEIGWGDALEILSRKIRDTMNTYGEEAVLLAQGAPKGLEFWVLLRLANALGVPNVAGIGNMCHMPREISCVLTFGFWPEVDYDFPPRSIFLWGSNLPQTNEEATISSKLKRALKAGAKLVVVDPRPTTLARKAHLWLKIRPGTDGALAMGIMRALVEEDLVDMEFVSRWTVGYEQLLARLGQYPLERVQQITWIPSSLIREAARIYGGNRPAAIQMGNALEHTASAHQTIRAIACLMALGGNLEMPGGNIRPFPPECMKPRDMVLAGRFPDRRKRMLSSSWNLHPLLATVPAQLAIKAMKEGDPCQVRFAYLQGTNPLLSYPDSRSVREAFEGLDFLAVSEIFMTPTALLADLVLPAATHMEFDDIGNYGLPKSFILARPKIVDPPGEAWPDLKILNELAKALGVGELFWEDSRMVLDDVLRPAGLDYEEFKERLVLWGSRRYRSYIQDGFNTPSRKVELRSRQLEERGLDPLPGFKEPWEGGISLAEDYPLVLTSGKDPVFFHSAYRQLETLRRISPEPRAYVSPETANSMGLKEGDWVWIMTSQGRIKQRLQVLEGLDPRVVCGAYGWWFPDKAEEAFFGWEESNLNLLTKGLPEFDPLVGSVNLRGIPCRLEKAQGP